MDFNPLATYVKERQGKRVIRKALPKRATCLACGRLVADFDLQQRHGCGEGDSVDAKAGGVTSMVGKGIDRWTFIEFGSEQIITFVAMATQEPSPILVLSKVWKR